MNTIWICEFCGAAIPSQYAYCLNCGNGFQNSSTIQNDLKFTGGVMKHES